MTEKELSSEMEILYSTIKCGLHAYICQNCIAKMCTFQSMYIHFTLKITTNNSNNNNNNQEVDGGTYDTRVVECWSLLKLDGLVQVNL